MINKIVLGLGVLLSLIATTFPAYATPMASLYPQDNDIVVGENFFVSVFADGNGINEELLAFGFDVYVEGTAFSYDGYSIESGFDDLSSGANNVAGDVFPGIPDNNVLLATLSFSALSAGTGVLTIDGLFDFAFSGLYYEQAGCNIFDSMEIDINAGPSPVPAPAAIVLLGTGLVGLAGFRKQLK